MNQITTDDLGQLAVWRLITHSEFGGTWLSDYVPNQLGGFIQGQAPQKPDCQLIGENGNIFNLIGLAASYPAGEQQEVLYPA